MEHNDKIKKAFWITEDMDREIDAHLKQDNCSSRSEFVMNALKFYVGYLNTKNASAFLPEVLSATLTVRWTVSRAASVPCFSSRAWTST